MVTLAMIASPKPLRPDYYVALVPVLMLADYYLTILFAWRVKCIHESADLAALELNPMWKSDVANLRLFNLRHLIHVVFFTVIFVLLSQAPEGFPRQFFLCLVGFCISLNAVFVGTHIHNLAVLRQIHFNDDHRSRRTIIWNRGFVAPAIFFLLAVTSLLLGPFFLLGGTAGIAFASALRLGLEREARGKKFWERDVARN